VRMPLFRIDDVSRVSVQPSYCTSGPGSRIKTLRLYCGSLDSLLVNTDSSTRFGNDHGCLPFS
jgi:hypothetical protein